MGQSHNHTITVSLESLFFMRPLKMWPSVVIAKAWLPWQPTQSNACILDISSNRCGADLSRFLETQICQNTKNKAVRLMQKVLPSVLEKSQNCVTLVLYGFTRCIQNVPLKMNNIKICGKFVPIQMTVWTEHWVNIVGIHNSQELDFPFLSKK